MWLFLGMNELDRDVHAAVQLAHKEDFEDREHEDLIWFRDTFPPYVCSTKQAISILEGLISSNGGTNASRICFFLGSLTGPFLCPNARELIRRSAGLNFGPACGWMASFERDVKLKRDFAERGAKANDPQSMLVLASASADNKKKDLLERASKFGHAVALWEYGRLCDRCSEKYAAFGKALACGLDRLDEFSQLVNECKSKEAWFFLGKVLRGHVNRETRSVFRRSVTRDDMGMYCRVVGDFEKSVEKAVDAIVCFNLACRRELKTWINKDVRKMICEFIWVNASQF